MRCSAAVQLTVSLDGGGGVLLNRLLCLDGDVTLQQSIFSTLRIREEEVVYLTETRAEQTQETLSSGSLNKVEI